jgi:hypothetical protein
MPAITVHRIGSFHIVVAGCEHPWRRGGAGLDRIEVHVPDVRIEFVEAFGRIPFSDKLGRLARSRGIGVRDITGDYMEVGP